MVIYGTNQDSKSKPFYRLPISEMNWLLEHHILGNIGGTLHDDVVQFKGIKYATLRDRFAPSELCEPTSTRTKSGVLDATRPGPMVIGPKAWDVEFSFIQKSLPMPNPLPEPSELDGLNLNVTVPFIKGKLPAEGVGLPVFMFVHGGGFGLGSNAWPQYDQTRCVRLSAEMGMPVIGVGINYRLGLPGFLTSAEMREAGYVSNNGLRDQTVALRWIKRYIGGFGGDAANVTFVGQSAGSVSGSLHLHSKAPLFKRLINMSGTSLMLRPIPAAVSETVYAEAVKILGLEPLSPSDRIRALLEVPTEKLVGALPPTLPLLPVVDGHMIPSDVTYAQASSNGDELDDILPGRHWCKEILLGDTQFDASIMTFMLGARTKGIARPFCDSMAITLNPYPGAVSKLLQLYDIEPDMSDAIALRKILQFVTDISFYATNLAFAQGWPGKAWVYHFNEPNPWDGHWKGEAGHVLDVAFVFQNYNEHLEPKQREVAVGFAKDFIRFFNGKMEWAPYVEGKESARAYGPSERQIIADCIGGPAVESSGRKSTIHELAKGIGLDALAAAWGSFLTGS